MRSPKIAYLASEYPAISHTFILREIKALRKQGFEVITASIRTSDHLDKMRDVEQREAEHTLYIKNTPITEVLTSHLRLLIRSPLDYGRMCLEAARCTKWDPSRLFKAVAYLAEAGVLIDWMQSQEVSHVHVHFANPAATVALIASRYGDISYSLSIHGPDVFYNVDKQLLREKIKAARFVRAISHYCLSQLQRLIPYEQWDRCHIVRCGVDPQQFSPVDGRQENAVAQLLCVGRLVSAKGMHTLLNSCRRLSQEGVPFQLTFIGDGEDRQSLTSLAQSFGIDGQITFAGALGQNEVRQAYQQADLFVLPSYAEGVPVVLMEAMATGIPVIATRITGIPELIEHGKEGVLVPPADSGSLAAAIAELIRSPERRREYATLGRQKVLERYHLDKNCEEMADLFKDYL